MKKNRTVITIFLVIMTVVLLGTTVYISILLTSASSPTQIQKTKAAAVTYTRKVDLFPTGIEEPPISISPPISLPSPPINLPISPLISPPESISPLVVASATKIPTAINTPTPLPTKASTLLAQAPILTSTVIPTKIPPTPLPTLTVIPMRIREPTVPPATPTLQPLLAYKSTTISPTLIPATNTGGMADPTKAPSPTKKAQPTGVQQLPETGWIQASSILFIVAASTILFSLLF